MLLTSLALSGAALAALNAVESPKKTRAKAGVPATHKQRPRRLAKRIDDKIQKFFINRVDPFFTSRERAAQAAEFDAGLNQEEAQVNRRIVFSGATAALAAAGAVGVPFATGLGVVGVFAVMTPWMINFTRASWREKRLKYRFVASTIFLVGMTAGHALTGSLLVLAFAGTFKLSARTKAAAQASMRAAFGMQPPEKVWTVVEGVEVETPFDQLEAGDVIVVAAGQSIPVDGVVVAGEGAADQHALTGESRPAEKAAGDPVLANTVLLSGRLQVRVERAGTETAAAQIGEILANASDAHMDLSDRSEQFADRIMPPLLAASAAALYTVGSSGALAVMSGGFGSTATIAGPMCMISFLNIASQQGVLIKDGRALERLSAVDAVVFDKTGTLTQEQPIVAEAHAADGVSVAAVLRCAALAEHRQTHPIAKAILAEAAAAGIVVDAPDDAEYAMGMGVSVVSQNREIHVGSGRFLSARGVPLADAAPAWREACDAEGGTLVYVAVDGVCIGAIRLRAQLRPETETLIAALRAKGVKTYILSGDARAPTEHLAAQLRMDGCFAEVLPEDKERVVADLQTQGRTVCFVGDGINDALALKQADVSISMRGATSVATDSAQIVLMNASLKPIDGLFELGAQFDRTLRRTLALGNGSGVALIGGVFLFGLGMPASLPFYIIGMSAAVASALEPMRALRNSSPEVKTLPNPGAQAVIAPPSRPAARRQVA